MPVSTHSCPAETDPLRTFGSSVSSRHEEAGETGRGGEAGVILAALSRYCCGGRTMCEALLAPAHRLDLNRDRPSYAIRLFLSGTRKPGFERVSTCFFAS